MTDLEQFKADATAKRAAWEATIIPRMKAVQEYYAEKHGLGIVGNATRATRR